MTVWTSQTLYDCIIYYN